MKTITGEAFRQLNSQLEKQELYRGRGINQYTIKIMPSEQTTLSSRGSMAEQLAEDQQEISIAEFFEKNKQMLGFDSKSRAIVTAVKEAVDNSLDATEEAGFLPEISVDIEESGDYYKIIIEDNGPGITEEQIPKIFGKLLYGSRFSSRTQSRGQQGIGISAAVLYSHKTSGKPAKIRSKPENEDEATQLEVMIDTDTNEPVVENKKSVEWDKDHGTRIELEMEANMRGRKQLHEYARGTALVNPHATIKISEPQWEFESERVSDELPPETEEIKPHPHGIEIGTLQEMLQVTTEDSVEKFMREDFTKVGRKTADNILTTFKDYYFGRELGWDSEHIFTEDYEVIVEDDEEDEEETDEVEVEESEEESVDLDPETEFTERIMDVVYGKSPEATEQFATCVYDEFKDSSNITYYSVKETVTNCARNVERDQDERLGSTVQEKATEAVWEFVQERRISQLYDLIDSSTSQRKSEEAVKRLALAIDELLEKNYPDDTVTERELRVMIDNASDHVSDQTGTSIGDTARGKIMESIWGEISSEHPYDVPELSTFNEDRDAAEALLNAMKDTKVNAPSKKCLSPITPEKVEDGLRSTVNADFYTASQRDGEVYKGSPFIVEAGIAYGGDIEGADDQINLRRFANRVPLVYQQGACAITQVTENINWRNYNLKQSGGGGALPRGPMVLLVHIASTNVPFTSESKDAVSSAEIIEQEVERAVRSCARDLKKHLKQQRDLKKRREKRDTIGDVLPPLAESLSEVVGRNTPDSSESVARIMNNIFVDYNEDETSLIFQNHLTKGASITVNVDGDEKEINVSSGEEVELEADVTEDITIQKIEGEKVTLSEAIQNTADNIEVVKEA